jgi:hydroxyquinol 1,2-dioxygenase
MTVSTARVRTENETAILSEVRQRFEKTGNPRLRQLALGLIDHLHAFVGENRVTWEEWEAFMAFLARGAAVTKDGRNEFIALSDSIGVSMQVLAASQPKPPGATIPTLIGPFFLKDAPIFPIGADIANGASGQPLYAYGRVLDTSGEAIKDAIVNVWQSDDRGLYDVQDDFNPENMWGRGRIRCDADGHYGFWSVMPTAYPAPMDAALGDLITNTTRKHWRPAHLHFAIETETADSLCTHIFVRGSKYLDSDVAFGVRPQLIADFAEHSPGAAPDGSRRDQPYRTLHFDFVLTRAGK